MANTELSEAAMKAIAKEIKRGVEAHPAIKRVEKGPPRPTTDAGTRYVLLSLDGRYDESDIRPLRDDPLEAAKDALNAAWGYISDEVEEDPTVLIWRRNVEFKFIPRHRDNFTRKASGGGYTCSMRLALEAA